MVGSRFIIDSEIVKRVLVFNTVLVLIFCNYSMLTRDTLYHVPEEALIAVLFGSCALCSVIDGFRFVKRYFYILVYSVLLILLMLIIALIINRGVIVGLNSVFFPMLSYALLFKEKENVDRFWLMFADFVVVLAILSLILYLGGTVFGILSPNRIAQYIYAGHIRQCKVYLNIQYESQSVDVTSGLIFGNYRNCGFFIEGTMFSSLLSIALGVELSFRKKRKLINIIILVITIITTFSTTGYIVLIVAAGMSMMIYTSQDNSKLKYVLKKLLIPFNIVLVFFLISYSVAEKQKSISGVNSYNIRMDHLLGGLRMLKDSPLIGIGYLQDSFMEYVKYKQGASMGLPIFLGRNGLFLFLLYFVPLFAGIRYALVYKQKYIYFFVICFVTLLFTAITEKPIMSAVIWTQIALLINEEESVFIDKKYV